MLYPAHSHGRALFLILRPSARLSANLCATSSLSSTTRRVCRQRRWASAKGRSKDNPNLWEVSHPLAQELKDTRIWVGRTYNLNAKPKPKGRPKKKGPADDADIEPDKRRGDRLRVNIVNPDLVHDIVEYIKPTLERHKGCDLISVYPGSGLWTKALHDAVQPRSHLLLEPDEDLYRPFLQPLLDEDGVRLIPKSGIVWNELNQVLTPEYLPQQTEIRRSPTDPLPRNDTLLVTINLAMHPKKKFHLFESMSRMVLYQLVSSLRSSSLFQKYGKVRMLVWIPDDEKYQLLPRVLHHRTRLAIESELCTEYVAEACGLDSSANLQGKRNSRRGVSVEEGAGAANDGHGWNTKRWGQLDMESMRMTLNRMREAGIETPEGRETHQLQQFRNLNLPLDEPIPLTKFIPIHNRQSEAELEWLEKKHERKPMLPSSLEWKRLKALRNYHIALERELRNTLNFLGTYDEFLELYRQASASKDPSEKERLASQARKLEAEWDEAYDKLPAYLSQSVFACRDMLHLQRQPADLGPILSWDRRPYEPLRPTANTDFFPNVPCALLDIQPKTPDPLIRAMGPGSTNSGDMFDLMLGSFLSQRRKPVTELLDVVWPGAREGLAPNCPSLTDPDKGGIPARGKGAISARALNQVQLMEVLREFVSWPFKPHYQDMVGRLADEGDDGTSALGDEDSLVGNTGTDQF